MIVCRILDCCMKMSCEKIQMEKSITGKCRWSMENDIFCLHFCIVTFLTWIGLCYCIAIFWIHVWGRYRDGDDTF